MNRITTRRASPRLALLATLTVGAVAAGWSTQSAPGVAVPREELSSSARACLVTRPQEDGSRLHPGFDYGSDALDVILWPLGVLRAGPLPDGASDAEI